MKYMLAFLIFIFALSVSQEVSVPFDSAGKVQVINEKLNKQFGLFPDISGFKRAQIFRISDTLYSFEIIREANGKLMRERKTISKTDYLKLMAKVDALLVSRPVTPEIRAARIKLLTGSMLLSMGYYGWALPYSLDVDDERSFVALYMFTSASGFIIPLIATSGHKVTDAEATMAIYGGTRGIIHGIYLSHLFNDNPDLRTIHGLNVATSVFEGIGGFVAAHAMSMSSGTADIIGTCGDFGSWLGWGTAFLADYNLDDHPKEKSGLVLTGQVLGVAAGKIWSDKQDFTRGDATIVYGNGILGGILGGGIAIALNKDNSDLTVSSAMVGSVLGLASGGLLTEGKDFTTGQGALIALSEAAGGLLGLGIGYLSTDNVEYYLLSTALGASLGFGIAYSSFMGNAKVVKNLPINITINPLGMLNSEKNEIISLSLKF